jgi:hypothetical protein
LYEKFESVDPSHPLGGRDGIKDIICKKGGSKFIAACYFPRGQQTFGIIKKKFSDDLEGVLKNGADGIAFITNQELTLSEREELSELIKDKEVEIYHLERIAAILGQPVNYGIRLAYLDIEMSIEEQLSYTASKDQFIQDLFNYFKQVIPWKSNISGETTSIEQVAPEKYSMLSFPGVGLATISPIHRCSHCEYGFKIAGRSFNALNISSYYSKGIVTVETITCPNCGNVDKLDT